MPIARRCLKAFPGLVLLLAEAGTMPAYAEATTLHFSANLVPGSCDVSLDMPRLVLDTVKFSEVRPNTLTGAKRFELKISDCNVSTTLKPFLSVTGDGERLDKWAFRDAATSTAQNVGVMLVRDTGTPPIYTSPAIADKGKITLDTTGDILKDQTLAFYAGLICGNTSTCRTASVGAVNAMIEFTLAYP